MSTMKRVLLGAWVALAVIAVIAAGSTAGSVAMWLLALLVIVHLVEMAVFYKRCREAGGSLAAHMLNVFLFGVLHIKELTSPNAAG